MVKNLPANAGDMGLIPELEGSPGAGNGNPLQFLAWKTLWTEGPGGLQSMGLHRVRYDRATEQRVMSAREGSPVCKEGGPSVKISWGQERG